LKTEPEVDQDELAIVVMEEYDLDLQEWCFWPQGWESYGFIASDGHQRVFVKLLDPRLSSHQPGVRQCKQAHRVQIHHRRYDEELDDFAIDLFAKLQASTAGAEGPPPLGLHLLMGDTSAVKVENMIANISQNLVAPVEIVAVKTG
jgi:hypothetical protein